jgi:hypothetical protein
VGTRTQRVTELQYSELSVYIFFRTVKSNFKGTVSRDFLLLVFFLNQFPPSF